MKKVAVVLSGCGHQDGAEITESVSLLIALGQAGAHVTCFAPDVEFEAIDHRTGQTPAHPKRNVLEEAARIARGKILDVATLRTEDFDALAFPGGYGAAKVLCNWATAGSKAEVRSDVARLIQEFHAASKPIGAACIAPVLLALTLGKKGVTLTIGNDVETAAEITKAGAHHENCPVNDYVTDREMKVITTPAYMYDAQPHEVFAGISGMAKELVEMA